MKVLVLGSGVVGVTTAWYLAQAGHEVTVVDRQPGAGLETSFANAGQVSPGYSAPWAGPGIPLKAAKWLLMKYRPFVFWPMPDPHLWSWLVQMLENCNTPAYDRNKGRMVRLAEYSRDVMCDLRHQTGIQYDDRQQGTLQVFRTQKQMDGIAQDIAVLKQYNVPYEVLNTTQCVQAEPGLAPSADKIVGGCACREMRQGMPSSSPSVWRIWRLLRVSPFCTAPISVKSVPREGASAGWKHHAGCSAQTATCSRWAVFLRLLCGLWG